MAGSDPAVNVDLKTGTPLSKSPESYSLLRCKKSISDDLTNLVSKVRPCLTSSGVTPLSTVVM